MSQDSLPTDDPDPIGSTLRVTRMIECVLVAGVGLFLAIVLVMRSWQERGPAGNPWTLDTPLSLLAVGYAALVVVLHVVIAGQVVTQGRRAMARAEWPTRDPIGSARWSELALAGLTRLYQTAFIIGSAILEGGAMLAVVAFLIEGRIPCLIAGVLLMLGLAARIPRRDGLEQWVETQGERLEQERAGLS